MLKVVETILLDLADHLKKYLKQTQLDFPQVAILLEVSEVELQLLLQGKLVLDLTKFSEILLKIRRKPRIIIENF